MKNLRLTLGYRLPVYIAGFLVPLLIWSMVFSALAEPAPNERLSVAYFGDGCDISSLAELLSDNLSDITEQSLSEFDFNLAVSHKADMLSTLVEARIYTSDILIFSGDIWDDELIKNNIAPIPSESLEILRASLPEDTVYHYIDGRAYGVLLVCEGRESLFSSYYTNDDAPLLIFSSESVNLKRLYGSGEAYDGAGIDLAAYLLSEVNE